MIGLTNQYFVNKSTLLLGGRILFAKVVQSSVGQINQEYRLARPFARLLAPLTRSGLLASLTPSSALTRLLARSFRSLPRGTVNDWAAIYSVFFSILAHSVKLRERNCFVAMSL